MNALYASIAVTLLSSGLSACGGATTDSSKQTAGGNEGTCRAEWAPNAAVGSEAFDGLIDAAQTLADAPEQISSDLDADVKALASLYGIDAGSSDEAAAMDALVVAIRNDIAANTDGGVVATVATATCSGNEGIASLEEIKCNGIECASGASACGELTACRDAARLVGLASLTCTIPVVNLSFTIAPGVGSSEEADFYTRMRELEFHANSILAGRARLSALVDGKVNDDVLFDPSPLVQVSDKIVGLAAEDRLSPLGVPPACMAYALPQMANAGQELAKVSTEAPGLLARQNRFAGLF